MHNRSTRRAQNPMQRYRRLMLCIFLAWTAAHSSGCGTAIQPSALAAFSAGLAKTRQQTQTVFAAVNDLARTRSVELVIMKNEPGLTEDKFAVAVKPEQLREWDSAFVVLQNYATALGDLVSPNRPTQVKSASLGLMEELATNNTTNVKVPGAVQAAATQLASALVSAKAQSQAVAIMQQTDSDVRQVLGGLAEIIRTNLRQTARSNWSSALTEAQLKWANAVDSNNDAAKREAIKQFLGIIDQRDRQLAMLDDLHESLLLLADAHSAAARGAPIRVDGLVQIIDQHLTDARTTMEKINNNP